MSEPRQFWIEADWHYDTLNSEVSLEKRFDDDIHVVEMSALTKANQTIAKYKEALEKIESGRVYLKYEKTASRIASEALSEGVGLDVQS